MNNESLRVSFESPAKRRVYAAPPSKSYSHRYLIIASSIAEQSSIHNLLVSDDISRTVDGLRVLGAEIEGYGKGSPNLVKARAGVKDNVPAEIYCKDSASTLRFLAAQALRLGCPVKFTVSGQLARRPLGCYIKFFDSYGIKYSFDGTYPLTVDHLLEAGDYEINGEISSQYASGLMMALGSLPESSRIKISGKIESKSYIEMTAESMRRFGREVEFSGPDTVIIKKGAYRAADVGVEGDFSQAAFFIALGLLNSGIELSGLNMESLQADRRILDAIKKTGFAESGFNFNPDSGNLIVEPFDMKPCEFDISECPDLAPALALILSFAEGKSLITGCRRLKYKESDRLCAVAGELNKIGAEIEIKDDEMIIVGKKELRGGSADSHGDHRLAMMLGVAASRCAEPVVIGGFNAVSKSYPDFWEELADFGACYV